MLLESGLHGDTILIGKGHSRDEIRRQLGVILEIMLLHIAFHNGV